MNEEKERRPTTLLTRFGGFAAAHFVLSVLGVGILLLVLQLCRTSAAPLVVLAAALMAAYFPLGALTAREGKWTRPAGRREKVLAVLQPAMAAWAWAAFVVYAMGTERGDLMLTAVTLSLFLASPSSAFVILWLAAAGFLDLLPRTEDRPAILLSLGGFFAGLLPPLLFALGSFRYAAQPCRGRCPHRPA